MIDSSSCVYVFEHEGLYKVGQTTSLASRMARHERNHRGLELLCAFPCAPRKLRELEYGAHHLMRWWRVRSEWFEITEWSRRLVVDWMSEGVIHRPVWSYWIEKPTRAPMSDWESRGIPDRGSWRHWLM